MAWTLSFLVLLAALCCVQTQQVTQRTFRKTFLEAARKCSDEYNTPQGMGVSFFTNPENTDHNSKCFTMCLLNKFNLIDPKGNFQDKSMQPFLNSIPTSRFKETIERNLPSCLQENSKDACDKGFRFVQCFYRRASYVVSIEYMDMTTMRQGRAQFQ